MSRASTTARHAARGIWRSTVAALGRAPETATLVHRGPAAVWDALDSIAVDHATTVRRLALDDDDRIWGPDQVDLPEPQDVLWYHDPFDGHLDAGAEHDRIVAATSAVSLLVVMAYPHGVRDSGLRARVESVFDSALSVDPALVERTSIGLLELLGRAHHIRIGEDLVVDLPLPGRTDFTSATLDLPVLQLPLGECWLLVDDPSGLNGRAQAWAGAHRSAEIDVVDGHLHGPDGRDLGAIGELGFGVSPTVQALPGTTLPEKALGLVHLGLGDNRAIGGRVAGPPHGDVTMAPGTDVVCGMPSGRQIRWCRTVASPQWMVTHRGHRTRHQELCAEFLGPLEGERDGVISLFGEAGDGSVTNAEALWSVSDPRESELIRLPAEAVQMLGTFTSSGSHEGIAADAELVELWGLMTDELGSLPWARVRLVAVDRARWGVPRAMSVPGMVLFDHELLERPLTWRWLYLTHELAHQWIGGTFRFGPAYRSAWEDVCEGFAHASATSILGPRSSAVFQRLRDRQETPTELTSLWSDPMYGRDLLRAIVRQSLDGPVRSEDVPVPDAIVPRGEVATCSPTR